jgi:hypothetical protein
MMRQRCVCALALGISCGVLSAADYPEAGVSNGFIRARLSLPDTTKGYYRGTRFDWSGMITSLGVTDSP